jgi:hypothetical protein
VAVVEGICNFTFILIANVKIFFTISGRLPDISEKDNVVICCRNSSFKKLETQNR